MMDWLAANAGRMSDVFGLAASIFLFVPLVGLVSQSNQYRQLADLMQKDGITDADIRGLRQQIIDQAQSDPKSRWLILAGISFGLAVLFLAVSFIA